METLDDWAFALTAIEVPLVPLLWLAVLSAPRTHKYRTPMAWVCALVGTVVAAHWVVWWFSFDSAQGETYPNELFPVSTVLMYASGIGCVLVVIAAAGVMVGSLASPRPSRA